MTSVSPGPTSRLWSSLERLGASRWDWRVWLTGPRTRRRQMTGWDSSRSLRPCHWGSDGSLASLFSEAPELPGEASLAAVCCPPSGDCPQQEGLWPRTESGPPTESLLWSDTSSAGKRSSSRVPCSVCLSLCAAPSPAASRTFRFHWSDVCPPENWDFAIQFSIEIFL